MWDEQVNTAIDEVARQMTEGPPAGSADLRRRVLARIESGDAPRVAWRAAFVLSPLAVAAAIVVAVFVARGPRPGDVRRPGPLGPGVTSPETPLAASGRKGTADPEGAAGPEGPALQGQTVRGPQQTVRRPDQTALHVDALGVAPLTVDALTPDPIQIERLDQIKRLDAISPINVAPLEITDVQRRYE